MSGQVWAPGSSRRCGMRLSPPRAPLIAGAGAGAARRLPTGRASCAAPAGRLRPATCCVPTPRSTSWMLRCSLLTPVPCLACPCALHQTPARPACMLTACMLTAVSCRELACGVRTTCGSGSGSCTGSKSKAGSRKSAAASSTICLRARIPSMTSRTGGVACNGMLLPKVRALGACRLVGKRSAAGRMMSPTRSNRRVSRRLRTSAHSMVSCSVPASGPRPPLFSSCAAAAQVVLSLPCCSLPALRSACRRLRRRA